VIITDTGAFVALLSERDKHHTAAQQVFETNLEPLITTYPVISETCHLLARSLGRAAEQAFLQSIVRSVAEVFHIQTSHLERMVVLMKKYEDLPMDLADASLVLLAEELGEGRILTTDQRDFSVYRWNNTQPFQNLLLPGVG
jgi:uncharacterized protein